MGEAYGAGFRGGQLVVGAALNCNAAPVYSFDLKAAEILLTRVLVLTHA